jgi:hypothetical protein
MSDEAPIVSEELRLKAEVAALQVQYKEFKTDFDRLMSVLEEFSEEARHIVPYTAREARKAVEAWRLKHPKE